MRNTWVVLVWMLAVSLFGCGEEASFEHRLVGFFLETSANPGLSADVEGVVGADTVSIVVPEGTDVTALVPTFTFVGTKVVALGRDQISGVSAVDFTTPVTYRVVAANLTSQDYVVTVTTVPRTTKEITSFTFAIRP